jgi:high-affinity iron transporter
MASHAAGFLVQAGLVPALVEPLWDSSGLLRESSLVGQVLGALIGYDDQPSAMQVIFFAVTLAAIGTLMQVVDRPRTAAPASGRIPTPIQQS